MKEKCLQLQNNQSYHKFAKLKTVLFPGGCTLKWKRGGVREKTIERRLRLRAPAAWPGPALDKQNNRRYLNAYGQNAFAIMTSGVYLDYMYHFIFFIYSFRFAGGEL